MRMLMANLMMVFIVATMVTIAYGVVYEIITCWRIESRNRRTRNRRLTRKEKSARLVRAARMSGGLIQ